MYFLITYFFFFFAKHQPYLHDYSTINYKEFDLYFCKSFYN